MIGWSGLKREGAGEEARAKSEVAVVAGCAGAVGASGSKQEGRRRRGSRSWGLEMVRRLES